MLTNRQLQILGLIIKRYVDEETPIGSKKLMEDGIKASSATIRNDMSILETLGLLQKNHISSGRIPSLLGYQYYVEHLLTEILPNLSKQEVIRKNLQADFSTVGELLQRVVNLITQLTNYTSFALSIDSNNQILRDFRIISLNKRQALSVMVTNIGNFENKVINIPTNVSKKDLENFTRLINERLLGEKLTTIYSRLKTEFPVILQRYFPNSYSLLNLLEIIWQDAFADEIYLSGHLNLLKYHVIQNEQEFQELYSYFNNSQQFIHLIKQIRNSKQENHGIHLGLNLATGLFLNMSILTIDYEIDDKGQGILGIIGPLNIHYGEIIGLLNLVAARLSERLREYSRYLDSAQL